MSSPLNTTFFLSHGSTKILRLCPLHKSIRYAFSTLSLTTILGIVILPTVASAKDMSADSNSNNERNGVSTNISTSTSTNKADIPITLLDTVIVTAGALQPQASDMATATSIVTSNQLNTQVHTTLGDALANELGVSTDTFGQGASRPIIRGQTAPRVQVMQNGLSVQDASQISPDHQVSVPVMGAKQIEVIKGTSALMYGGGAIGGVVNIVDDTIPTKPVDKNLSGKVTLAGEQATDGYLGYAELKGDINNNWTWAGSFQKTDKGNLQVPHWDTDVINNSWYTQDNASIGLSYINDLDYLGFSYQHLASEYGLPFHVHNQCAPSASNSNKLTCDSGHNHTHSHSHDHAHEHGEPPYVDLVSDIYQIRTEHLVPAIGIDKVNTKISYTDYHHDEIDEGVAGTTFTNKALDARVQATHGTYKTGNLGFIKGVVGMDYTNSDFSAQGLEGYLPKTDRTQVGLYFIERLSPTYFGAKIESKDKFDANNSATDHAGHSHSVSGTDGAQSENSTSAILARQGRSPWYIEFGGRQEFQDITDTDNHINKTHSGTSVSLEGGKYITPTTQISARVSHSERLPASQELFADGAHLATNTWERGNILLDKESTNGVELTLRYDNNDDFDISASAFYNDSEDYIYAKTQDVISKGESAGFRLVDYAQSDAKHYGGEIKARYYINDRLSIGSFADIALIELEDSTLDSKYAPRLTAPRIGGDLTAQVGQFDLVLSGYHRFKQDKIADFETITPSYNMMDAKVVYHSPSSQDYTAFLQVNNILNELAYNHASYLAEHVPLTERSVNAGITYRF